MTANLAVGLLATVVEVAAFAWYNINIFRGTSIPNPATWTLWVFLTVLNAGSYAAMTDDLAKFAFPIAAATATMLTWGYALLWGKFKPLDLWDLVVFGIGVSAAIVWYGFKSATFGNLLVQLAVAVAFWPTYKSVWDNPASERPGPWYLWALAYFILFWVVILSWRGQYQDLVYPVGCVIWHLILALMSHQPSASGYPLSKWRDIILLRD